MKIPNIIQKNVIKLFDELPYRERGIIINEELIIITMEILNKSKDKTLPQNCKKERIEKTPFGLDKLIKEKLGDDTMRATIISDELQKKGIVTVFKAVNEKTGRLINHTKLNKEWTW